MILPSFDHAFHCFPLFLVGLCAPPNFELFRPVKFHGSIVAIDPHSLWSVLSHKPLVAVFDIYTKTTQSIMI